jgi:hypothetical protein
LKIYLYDEGLVRFATEKYEKSLDDTKNVFAHLTNYSINKKNLNRFVQPGSSDEKGKSSSSEQVEFASKWSLS